jgi:hypothetical protein
MLKVYQNKMGLGAKVWTSYLSSPKSKPKNHLFSGVISVRILWLGRWFLVQTFEEDEDELLQDIREIKDLLSEGDGDNA